MRQKFAIFRNAECSLAETMMTYFSAEKTLFSCDCFGGYSSRGKAFG